jgi:hypothetical protein
VIDEDKGLPASIVGLFGTAFTLYRRRLRLYALLALIALAVEYAVDILVLADPGLFIGLDIVLGAFLAATVSIGVAYDLAHKDADWSTVVIAASLRWGVVAVVLAVDWLLQWLFEPYLFLSPDQTGYGVLLLPFIVLWGAVWIASVVAAIEPVKSRLTLPLLALGRGLAVSARFVNLGRLIMLSVIMTLPLLAEQLLLVQLQSHGAADAFFWANVPLDVLSLGPLQALATVFYVDFLRRAKR